MTQHQNPPAPPQYSPDGRWWWTGSEWVPVTYPSPIRSEHVASLVVGLALVGILLVAIVGWVGSVVEEHRPKDPVEQFLCDYFEDC